MIENFMKQRWIGMQADEIPQSGEEEIPELTEPI